MTSGRPSVQVFQCIKIGAGTHNTNQKPKDMTTTRKTNPIISKKHATKSGVADKTPDCMWAREIYNHCNAFLAGNPLPYPTRTKTTR